MVRNRGPLVPENEIPKLFHSMQSGRPGNDSQIHLGLGLYLVRLIAEFHDGRAWMKNEPEGPCFVITLAYAKSIRSSQEN
jgi:K+-sensing histidine kinase KdpD